MQKYIILALLFCGFFRLNSSAQSFAELYDGYQQADSIKSGELKLRFEGVGFFQNNEYVGDIVDGYTLPGGFVRPRISYALSNNLEMAFGAHFLKYYGRDELANIQPWFSVRYRFDDRWSVIIGNLDQNRAHGIPQQLYEPERILTDKPEGGLQFLYSGGKLNWQTWLNWEKFIVRDDPFREHFVVGVSGEWNVMKNPGLSVTIPAHALFYHWGGEIDATDLGVETLSNMATGWKMKVPFSGGRLKSINFDGYWMGYSSAGESEFYPYDKGHAFSLGLSALTRCSKLSLSFWNAYRFVAPEGRLLYQSVSDKDVVLSQADRSVLSLRYYWQKQITPEARIAWQFESWYDLNASGISYNYGIYLLLNPEFLLKRFAH